MGMMFKYTILLASIVVILNLIGAPTFTSQLITGEILSDPTNIYSSPFYLAVLAVLSLVVASIILGFFTKQTNESFLLLGLASSLLLWGAADLISIITHVSEQCKTECSWATGVIKFIFYPLLIGYLIVIVQWWRGNDN